MTRTGVPGSGPARLQEVGDGDDPVNGTELYYEELGHGPAVLFIHGMCRER